MTQKWNRLHMIFNQTISKLTECHLTVYKLIGICISNHYVTILFLFLLYDKENITKLWPHSQTKILEAQSCLYKTILNTANIQVS
jgi:hypothetical protein